MLKHKVIQIITKKSIKSETTFEHVVGSKWQKQHTIRTLLLESNHFMILTFSVSHRK